jgi:hypothetical protein
MGWLGGTVAGRHLKIGELIAPDVISLYRKLYIDSSISYFDFFPLELLELLGTHFPLVALRVVIHS